MSDNLWGWFDSHCKWYVVGPVLAYAENLLFMISVDYVNTGLTSRILTCTELKGHCFVCFSFWLRVSAGVC